MGMRYSGPKGNYPVYQCIADNTSKGRPRRQEVRALTVDVLLKRILLAALAPDQLALTLTALGQIEQETQALEQH
jgi:hypothetical protein